MRKDFDRWNKKKKSVNNNELKYTFFYHEREIWWSAIGINVGVETDGKNEHFERPILIIKKFNKHMFWGVPLTSHAREGMFYHEVSHEEGVSWAILSQMKVFSVKRLLRKMGMASPQDFYSIKKRLMNFLN